MSTNDRLPLALLLLRWSVFLVFAMWTIDKFVNPEHAAAVFAHFYLLPGLSANVFYLVGALQATILLAFLFGFRRGSVTA